MTSIKETSNPKAQPAEAPQLKTEGLEPSLATTSPLPTLTKKRSNLQVTSSKFTMKPGSVSLFPQEAASVVVESTDVTHSSLATEPINDFYTIPISEHLDLYLFKTKPCQQGTQHNHKHCPYYHNAKDKKRVGFFYSADLCEYAEKDAQGCMHGDSCVKAHNRVEQLYRPEKYKTKFCTFYPANLDKCEYGNFCSFAHSETDIVIELIHNYEYDDDFYIFHFKTIWCPFNLTQHDKALCVYAHNWQDYRRKPNMHSYDPVPCPNWKSTDFILNYEDGCIYRDKCTKCHGWKEHEYHPLNYKVKPCSSAKTCQKGRDCPHFHSAREKRLINSNIVNKIFRYVPKNRIVTNTFKVRADDRSIFQSQNASTSFSGSFNVNNPAFQTDSFFDPQINMSELLSQNTSKQTGLYCSLPDLGFFNQMPPLSDQLPEMKRKPSIENALPNDDDEQLRRSIVSMQEIRGPSNQNNKLKRQWSIGGAQEGDYVAENDRLFREIIFSPALNENIQGQKFGLENEQGT
jgi:hypothetical protein